MLYKVFTKHGYCKAVKDYIDDNRRNRRRYIEPVEKQQFKPKLAALGNAALLMYVIKPEGQYAGAEEYNKIWFQLFQNNTT